MRSPRPGEDRGDYARAFDFYQRGTARQRARVHYDPVQTEVMNDRLVEVYSAELLESMRGAGNPDAAEWIINSASPSRARR